MQAAATKRQFNRLVMGLRSAMVSAKASAETVVGSALTQWCAAQYRELPVHRIKTNRRLRSAPEIEALVGFLMSRNDLIEASYWLSSLYTKLVEPDERKRLAMYFTPPSLTRRLLDDLEAEGVDFSVNKFCDPACGGAAFLTPIALRMRAALVAQGLSPRRILDHIQDHIIGFDLEPVLCELSMHFLLMALAEDIRACGGWVPAFQVRVADSLSQTGGLIGEIDVVVCNPPYRKMSADEVEQYREAFADVIQAQPNLYGLFIALCIKLLPPDGVCALVTPTSFMSGQYFQQLRRHILSTSDVVKIGMVSDRSGVFIDVEQETALTLARKRKLRRNIEKPAMTAVSLVATDGTYQPVGVCRLPSIGHCWPIPRTKQDGRLLAQAASFSATLSDYGYRTRIGAFVWNRDSRQTFATAADANKRLSNARNKVTPLLWSSDIKPSGELVFDAKRKANSEDCLVEPGSKAHSSVISKPAVLLQRVTSNDQARRLICAPVPLWIYEKYGGFVGENHTVVLEQCVENPALSPSELAQLLRSSVIDRYYRCISGVTNVSAFELAQLRLPSPKDLRLMMSLGLSVEAAVEKLFLGGQPSCKTTDLQQHRGEIKG